VHLFPERAYRSGRRFLIIAAALSLLIHFAGGAIWALFRHTPPTATSPNEAEADAIADAITIERRTPPRRASHSRSAHAARAVQPPPARTRPLAVPTFAPVSFAPPREHLTPRAVRPVRVAVRVPREVPPPPAAPVHADRGAFSSQQLAALDGQFSRTIADAQRAVSEGPPQRVATTGSVDRGDSSGQDRFFSQIMAGNPAEIRAKLFVSGEGECTPVQGPFPAGRMAGYYIRCTIHYSDGFFEQVSFPWPFYFAPHKDPFNYRDNPDGSMHFPGQDPPSGFVLQPHFGLSRAVCSYFRPQCAAIIDAEHRHGDASYGTPP
jgi:hypothetical protein